VHTKVVLRRIGVISLAKIQGVLYALLGLIVGGFVSLFSFVGAAFAPSNAGAQFGAFFGAAAVVLLPIYGVIGFVTGLILGGLYNLLAGMMGGVEIETVQTPSAPAAPVV
jgi:hypothetical protein